MPGRDVNGARGRVLAIERTLRAAQHLDLRHIEKIESGGRDARVIDVVDIDADAQFDTVIGKSEGHADPADVDRRVARVRTVEL